MRDSHGDLINASALDAAQARLLPALRRQLELKIDRRCGFRGRILRRDLPLSELLDLFIALEEAA